MAEHRADNEFLFWLVGWCRLSVRFFCLFILVLIVCICWGQGVYVHVSAGGCGFQKMTLGTLELKSQRAVSQQCGCWDPLQKQTHS